jgi:hypothetical protein
LLAVNGVQPVALVGALNNVDLAFSSTGGLTITSLITGLGTPGQTTRTGSLNNRTIRQPVPSRL